MLSSVYGESVPVGLPLYHPESSLKTREGYYPNVSSTQHEAVRTLRGLLEEGSLVERFCHDDENEYLKLLRFLRARKFDVNKAFQLCSADVAWRADKLELRNLTSVDVLGCDSLAMYQFFPTWMHGFDKQLRPVSYRQFGKFEISKVLKLTTMEKLIKFHGWETEQAVRKTRESSLSSGFNVETFVLVVDAKGWTLSLATSDAFTFIKGMASTDADHYPERLGCMILINAPSVLSFAWRIIQAFLDDVTKAKIKIMGSDPKEWQPVLFDLIDRDQVPQMYGGFAADPTPETAFATMDPPPKESCSASDSTEGAPSASPAAPDSALIPPKDAAKATALPPLPPQDEQTA